jgi:hypothetical protein
VSTVTAPAASPEVRPEYARRTQSSSAEEIGIVVEGVDAAAEEAVGEAAGSRTAAAAAGVVTEMIASAALGGTRALATPSPDEDVAAAKENMLEDTRADGGAGPKGASEASGVGAWDMARE